MAGKAYRVNDALQGSDLNISLGSFERLADGTRRMSADDWQLAIQVGIYRELRKLNAMFACHNAQDIPSILRRIDKNTKKRPRKKKVKT